MMCYYLNVQFQGQRVNVQQAMTTYAYKNTYKAVYYVYNILSYTYVHLLVLATMSRHLVICVFYMR